MATKLTLTIDEEVIRLAKRLCKSRGQSLSGMVESYLWVLTAPGYRAFQKHDPQVARLKGVVQLPRTLITEMQSQKTLVKRYEGSGLFLDTNSDFYVSFRISFLKLILFMKIKFSPGNIIRSKSGGPNMIVELDSSGEHNQPDGENSVDYYYECS
ncbi:DUF6364 family protein [Chitinophaga sp. YIM B06452]|uniref:DUF6364 family protein n=1 Tax=Chitinophaga sp. YIM B06452 TaxID=3082158 RepID=UPI0031FE4BF7